MRQLNRITKRVTNVVNALIGQISWISPPWLRSVINLFNKRPGFSWVLLSIFLGFCCVAMYQYQLNRDEPTSAPVAVVITPPKAAIIQDEQLIRSPLTIEFFANNKNQDEPVPKSVAPLALLGKNATGIKLSPAIDGEWIWENDNRLLFVPKDDWLAGQTYSIHFSKETFTTEANISRMDYHFSTLPMIVSTDSLVLFQDPVNPKLRQALATIKFNYAVDPGSLESHTRLISLASSNQLPGSETPLKFRYTYDQFKRTAYLRSEPLVIDDKGALLTLNLSKGIQSLADHRAVTSSALNKTLLIPNRSDYFKVIAASATIVRNQDDRPEQILSIETSLGITEAELKKFLHVYLLPKNHPTTADEDEQTNYEWHNPGEVSPRLLALSTPLAIQAIPSNSNFSTLHNFKFHSQSTRYLYIKIDKGARAFGDFELSRDYEAVLKVPEYPREISFIHKGSLLALGGEQKLSVLVRGVPSVQFSFARILPDNINHLVTQTNGDFNNPLFINQSFDERDISEIYHEVRNFDVSDLGKQQYTAVDFSKYLSKASNLAGPGPHGLFLLRAKGWDPSARQWLDVESKRLILLTDLALIVKNNKDSTHDVFVQSISQGTPQANVKVSVLGKNGLSVLTRSTDAEGRVSFPNLNDYMFSASEPVAYLATQGSDVSFIPYNNTQRELQYSRYDVGGIYSLDQDPHNLTAYLFSDRDLYRPGESIHVGMIIKQGYVQPEASGLALQATVVDPRGTTIYDRKLTLNDLGYLSLDFSTDAAAPTGQYLVNLYISKDNHPTSQLGSLNIQVADFQPDHLRINSRFSQPLSKGWLNPEGLFVNVELSNLYGFPAANRRLTSKILLEPTAVKFTKYQDYTFVDPLVNPKKPAKLFTDDLPDSKTDGQGQAKLDLHLDRFEQSTYQLTLFAEGFEANGGRGVSTQLTALVSSSPYLIGYKPDGDLRYVKQHEQRNIQVIAVDPHLSQLSLPNLTMQLVALEPVSTLVKRPNGTYKYQSIIQNKLISSEAFTVDKQGSSYRLPTEVIGDFAINILDKNGQQLSHLSYSVVGASQQPLSRNAELNVKLNKSKFKAGEDIELQVTAPFTGAGLITLERDKVYSLKWFKTDNTNSVQTIHIPDDFQGNGYINVVFVRDWKSPDIFVSPLSHSIVPFTIDNSEHAIKIDLTVPPVAKPGDVLTINYHADKPGKIVVFAVDEGILQAAKYRVPDPLGFFFQKHALEVSTHQTVDQILPQYMRERELSSVGGDGGEELVSKYLNPFKRKAEASVAFWSGIIDADTTDRQISYSIPDYFNGSLKTMAVAVASDSVGAVEKTTDVRSDFIISPSLPNFVVPGDEFEVTATVANNASKMANDQVSIELKVSPGLVMIGDSSKTVAIPYGQEQTVRFKLHAKDALGSKRITVIATNGNKSSSLDASIGIRPATNFYTSIVSGISHDTQKILPIARTLYPQYRRVRGVISTSPLSLVVGLQQYLDEYPHGCTEQLISKAIPQLVLANEPWFKKKSGSVQDKIRKVIQTLGQRQMSNGAFGYWPNVGQNTNNTFASLYAMHFLTEAKSAGHSVPNDLFTAGISFLKDFVSDSPKTIDDARLQSYAIYLLTLNEVITSNYLTNLQFYLDKNLPDEWQHEIIGAYIAATYKLLQREAEANKLIDTYTVQSKVDRHSDFYNSNTEDAQYLYLLSKHFPDHLSEKGEQIVRNLVSSLNAEGLNTIFAAYSSLALGAYSHVNNQTIHPRLIIAEATAEYDQKILANTKQSLVAAAIDPNAKQVNFGNPDHGSFIYQLIEAGFDRKPNERPVNQGIEISREYHDEQGKIVDSVPVGSEIEVHLRFRALGDHYLHDVAIVDLLPGGFELISNSIQHDKLDYADVRDDRVVLYTGIDSSIQELVYRIKATTIGRFTIPAIFAESMYEPGVKGQGLAGTITITSVE
ncbi:MAG: alpha-2-macroglobulin family protein [Legionella sp.]